MTGTATWAAWDATGLVRMTPSAQCAPKLRVRPTGRCCDGEIDALPGQCGAG